VLRHLWPPAPLATSPHTTYALRFLRLGEVVGLTPLGGCEDQVASGGHASPYTSWLSERIDFRTDPAPRDRQAPPWDEGRHTLLACTEACTAPPPSSSTAAAVCAGSALRILSHVGAFLSRCTSALDGGVWEREMSPQSAAVDGKGAEPGDDAAHASIRTIVDVDIAPSRGQVPLHPDRRGARIVLPAAFILGLKSSASARRGMGEVDFGETVLHAGVGSRDSAVTLRYLACGMCSRSGTIPSSSYGGDGSYVPRLCIVAAHKN
jgi:hypothetical protein